MLLAVAALPCTAKDSRPVVEIAQGRLAGVTEHGVSSFKGIPYAAPPVGERRWRPPLPAAGWSDIRDADRFGAVCPQILRPAYSLEVLGDRPMSEDCLTLNVWTPRLDRGARRPVMVWILPGGFLMGDASMPRYDATALAHRDVVVVTFNYRLGMLGQFAHPALSRVQPDEPLGNYHLMDQIAALEWVRDNIEAFGGDPGNVTIFGMSAGGVSVNYHMAVPASAGLFDRAISESSAIRLGRPRRLSEDLPGLPSLETEGRQIAQALEIGGDDATIVARLRDLTVARILDYQGGHLLGVGGSLNPVVDGRLVVRGVGETFRTGLQARVPYMTGATSWEGSLLGWARSADPVLALLGITREQARALYGECDDGELNDQLYGDLFLESQRALARHHAATGQPTFVYYFSRVLDEHRDDLRGAAHGAEMRYVFGTLDSLTRFAAIGSFGNRPNDSDRRVAEDVRSYWVQFARTGDPNSTGLPGWPCVSPGNDLLLEIGQNGFVVLRDFRTARRDFWSARFDSGQL